MTHPARRRPTSPAPKARARRAPCLPAPTRLRLPDTASLITAPELRALMAVASGEDPASTWLG